MQVETVIRSLAASMAQHTADLEVRLVLALAERDEARQTAGHLRDLVAELQADTDAAAKPGPGEDAPETGDKD